MTRSNRSIGGNSQTNQCSRKPSVTWWRHRFSEIDASVEDINGSFEESLDGFWTGIPEKYEVPQGDVDEDEQTKLESVGDPPEEFSRAFEVANRLHEIIQEPQGYQTQLTPETAICTVVENIPRAGPIIVTNLKKEGYEILGDLDGATNSELMSVKRVGTETAERLIEFTQNQKLGDQHSNQTRDRPTIEDDVELNEISDQISGFGNTSRKKIEKAGYETVGDVRAATANELTEIKQIGEVTVWKLLDYIENHTEKPNSGADTQISDDTSIEDFAADVPKVGRVLVSKLIQEGYETVGDLRAATINELTTVEHIGEKKAESLFEYTNLRE